MDLLYIFRTPSVAFLGTKGAPVASIAKVEGVVGKFFWGLRLQIPRSFLLLFSPLNRSHAPPSLIVIKVGIAIFIMQVVGYHL